MKNKERIQERITNLNTLGLIPADEIQLNIDVVYNSILDEIVSVVPMNSPRQIVSILRLKYGSKEKAVTKNKNKKDVIDVTLMNSTGSMPLDENGYITDNVVFEVSSSPFMGNYKKIIPGTIKIGEDLIDDGNGNILSSTDNSTVGSVDYITAIFNVPSITSETEVKYKFDIYNLNTDRNLAYFQKSSTEIFADLYQLDVDSALVLKDFKGVNLSENIKNIMPQVLSQQIDTHVLSKYFDYIDNDLIHTETWDAKSANWPYDQGYSITELFEDFGTLVNLELGMFARRTGIVPNVIICDPLAFSVLKVNHSFKPLENKDNQDLGLPKKVGYFGDAKVFVIQDNKYTETTDEGEQGRLIITYKGPSESQTSAVFAPFIPVTLRNVQGAESGGMIVTNNIYSIGGFKITNPELISGVKVINVKFPQQ